MADLGAQEMMAEPELLPEHGLELTGWIHEDHRPRSTRVDPAEVRKRAPKEPRPFRAVKAHR